MTVSPTTSITLVYENYRKEINVNKDFRLYHVSNELCPGRIGWFKEGNQFFYMQTCKVIYIKTHDSGSTQSTTTKLVLKEGAFHIPGFVTLDDITWTKAKYPRDGENDLFTLTDNKTFKIMINTLSMIALEHNTTETTTPGNNESV